MSKKLVTGMLTATLLLISYLPAKAERRYGLRPVPFQIVMTSRALADDGSPYGRSKKGHYGEKRAVINEEEARMMLKEYFGNDGAIGKITRKKFYFEAEIRDRSGKVTDRVIIDRRSGRIRSVY